MRLHTLAAALFAASLTPIAHAVVEPGYWSLSAAADGSGNHSLSIGQVNTISPTLGTYDYTGIGLNYNASSQTLAVTSRNIDEGADLFVTLPGATISQALVTQGTGSVGSLPVFVGKDFWLGVATSHNSDPGFTWATYQNRTTFGWAHIQAQTDGTLKLLDSAMAFREPGIVVGKLQAAVPEPGTWALMGLGLVGVALGARRRQAA